MKKIPLTHLCLALFLSLLTTGCTSGKQTNQTDQSASPDTSTQTDAAASDSASTTDPTQDEQTGSDELFGIKPIFAPQTISDACMPATLTFELTNQSGQSFSPTELTAGQYDLQLIRLDKDNKVVVLGSTGDLSKVADFESIAPGAKGRVTFTLVSPTDCNPSDPTRCNGFQTIYPNQTLDIYLRLNDEDGLELARSSAISIKSQVWSDTLAGSYVCGDAYVSGTPDE